MSKSSLHTWFNTCISMSVTCIDFGLIRQMLNVGRNVTESNS